MGRVLHIIENSDLRCRHEGLTEWAKKNGCNFSKFNPGDIVAFLNTTKTHLAILVMLDEADGFGFLGQYKSPHGRVPPEALFFIPQALGLKGFEMNKAIKLGLEKLLAKKRKTKGVAK